MRTRDRQHQDELRKMDKEKSKRENEYMLKTKNLQEKHDSEMKRQRQDHE